jgi:hypothetical protein
MVYFIYDKDLDDLIDVVDITEEEKKTLESKLKHKGYILISEKNKDEVFTNPFEFFD